LTEHLETSAPIGAAPPQPGCEPQAEIPYAGYLRLPPAVKQFMENKLESAEIGAIRESVAKLSD
jgi:hypothetical protein